MVRGVRKAPVAVGNSGVGGVRGAVEEGEVNFIDVVCGGRAEGGRSNWTLRDHGCDFAGTSSRAQRSVTAEEPLR